MEYGKFPGNTMNAPCDSCGWWCYFWRIEERHICWGCSGSSEDAERWKHQVRALRHRFGSRLTDREREMAAIEREFVELGLTDERGRVLHPRSTGASALEPLTL